MAKYKTIAGPIGLTVTGDTSYADAVRQYAAIIDAETIGGWELLLIEQIPVTKHKLNIRGMITVALIGAAVGFFMGNFMGGSNFYRGGLSFEYVAIGAILGAITGAILSRTKVTEHFNMLVFEKKG